MSEWITGDMMYMKLRLLKKGSSDSGNIIWLSPAEELHQGAVRDHHLHKAGPTPRHYTARSLPYAVSTFSDTFLTVAMFACSGFLFRLRRCGTDRVLLLLHGQKVREGHPHLPNSFFFA